MKRFIVKVQLSLSTDPPMPQQALIYDQKKTVFMQLNATEEIIERVNGPKRYFWAHIHKGMIVLEEEAPVQDW